jgi:hypothetical protein
MEKTKLLKVAARSVDLLPPPQSVPDPLIRALPTDPHLLS